MPDMTPEWVPLRDGEERAMEGSLKDTQWTHLWSLGCHVPNYPSLAPSV